MNNHFTTKVSHYNKSLRIDFIDKPDEDSVFLIKSLHSSDSLSLPFKESVADSLKDLKTAVEVVQGHSTYSASKKNILLCKAARRELWEARGLCFHFINQTICVLDYKESFIIFEIEHLYLNILNAFVQNIWKNY